MLDHLARIDRDLFLAVNGWRSVALDAVLAPASNLWLWFPLYLFFLFLIQQRTGWRGLLIAVPVIAAMVFMTDTGSVLFFKETVQRLRPCHAADLRGLVHLIDDHCGGKYGFVSSHAANHFGIAAFMAGVLHGRPRWGTWLLLAWAMLIGYSRIYLGQHYPGDVIAGGIYGAAIGALFFLIFRALFVRVNDRP